MRSRWHGCDGVVGDVGAVGRMTARLGRHGQQWVRSGWHVRDGIEGIIGEGEIGQMMVRFGKRR